jgi:hypothetical protein
MASLRLPDIWCRYVGIGGAEEPAELARYLAGAASWPTEEHNLVAHALNERLWELELPSVAPLRGSVPVVGAAGED